MPDIEQRTCVAPFSKTHCVQCVRATSRRRIAHEAGRPASHVGKKEIRNLYIGHGIPWISISTLVAFAGHSPALGVEVIQNAVRHFRVAGDTQQEYGLIGTTPGVNRSVGKFSARQHSAVPYRWKEKRFRYAPFFCLGRAQVKEIVGAAHIPNANRRQDTKTHRVRTVGYVLVERPGSVIQEGRAAIACSMRNATPLQEPLLPFAAACIPHGSNPLV